MKRHLIALAFFLCCLGLHAQEALKPKAQAAVPLGHADAQAELSLWTTYKQGLHWCFGREAHLEFYGKQDNQHGRPTGMVTEEGCATVANAAGELLFYTNGRFIWNRRHQQMSNGFGLMGHESSSQSCLVVKKPGSASLYYIFTVDAAESEYANGLNFTIVDMERDNGLGEVVERNVHLMKGPQEKLTATRHSNGQDIWVISYDAKNERFLAYLLTSTGVKGKPMLSELGQDKNTTNKLDQANIGCIRLDREGKQLAMAYRRELLLLYSFDAQTGKLRPSHQPIPLPNVYGVEFSPQGQFLYGSTMGQKGELWQYDLRQKDQSGSLPAHRLDEQEYSLGSIQFDPYGQLLVAQYGQRYLGRIAQPELPGDSSAYQTKGLSWTEGGKSLLGLPQFTFTQQCRHAALPLTEDTTLCKGQVYWVDLDVNQGSCTWSDGVSGCSRKLYKEGHYEVVHEHAGCSHSATVNLRQDPECRDFSLGPALLDRNEKGEIEPFYLTEQEGSWILRIYPEEGQQALYRVEDFRGEWQPPASMRSGVYLYELESQDKEEFRQGWFRVL